ncbi:peptidase S8 and S53 domain-containing protein [Tieghemostelium lacteum]|uniref:Peptidase S8 and S53 domain-containing protein n=1 Tax=Tieghemostelium lacteum TaxID=361077 RepID=A0A151Z323_TIELA|nr:peptidase S8 and S53 domain-containing protein [Tieghemostelium lacteum]|eukprot:KYQ88348.1 peptidase S8 and S53 domain-containing protein [Tieghemostelium lacteum]
MKRAIVFLTFIIICISGVLSLRERTLIANPIIPNYWVKQRSSNTNDFISFKILLKQRNLEKLNEYFWQVSDPKSSFYQEYLTKVEIDELIRPSSKTFKEVLGFLDQHDITISERTVFSDYILIETSAKKVEEMFDCQLVKYQNLKDGTSRLRLDGSASVPTELLDHIDFVIGLSEFFDHNLKIPHYDVKTNYDNSDLVTNDILITPQILKSYYQVPSDAKGTQSNNYQGIAAFTDYFSMGALQQFDKAYNIPAPNLTRNGTDCLDQGCDQYESDLDVQYMTAMAIGVPTIFMAHPNGAWILDYLQGVLLLSDPPLVQSISYGWAELSQCEVTDGCSVYGYNSVQYVQRCDVEFQKLGTMGVSVFVSDGDDGAPSLGGASGNCPMDHGTYCPTGCPHSTSLCSELTFEYTNNGTLCFFPMGIGADSCSNLLNDPSLQEVLNKFADANKKCKLAFETDRTNLPHVYSACECNQLNNITSNGITVGPYNFYAENGAIFTSEYPTSSPYVTSVGATQFLVSPPPHQNISQEVGASILTQAKITTGGGFSTFQPMPSYQQKAVQTYLSNQNNNIPPSYAFDSSMRAYPDIAFNGHNYNIYASTNQDDQDKCPCSALPVDGTSCSSPALAGLISLINDKLLANGKKPLGFLNPLLYQMAVDKPEAFNDITEGKNNCNRSYCCLYGYSAAEGWDSVSGWGSIVFDQFESYILDMQGIPH